MKHKHLQRLFSASLTLLVSVVVAGAVQAADTSKTKGMELGKLHAASGIKCANCHGDTKQPQPVPMIKCLSCHGDTKALAEKTANVKPVNPHESRHYGTEADCNLCHHQHKKSENFCYDCHNRFNFTVP